MTHRQDDQVVAITESPPQKSCDQGALSITQVETQADPHRKGRIAASAH
jgi:hypothetical protein